MIFLHLLKFNIIDTLFIVSDTLILSVCFYSIIIGINDMKCIIRMYDVMNTGATFGVERRVESFNLNAVIIRAQFSFHIFIPQRVVYLCM